MKRPDPTEAELVRIGQVLEQLGRLAIDFPEVSNRDAPEKVCYAKGHAGDWIVLRDVLPVALELLGAAHAHLTAAHAAATALEAKLAGLEGTVRALERRLK